MSWAAIIVAGVGAGTSIYAAQKKKKDAEKAAREAKKVAGERPTYKAGPEVGDVYNLASSEIDNPQAQDYATGMLENNAANGIDAILKSGGKADFSTIHNQFGTGLQSAISLIQRERAQKIASYNQAAYNKARSGDTEFQVNQLDPWKDNKQLANKLEDQAGVARADATDATINGIANVGTTLLATGILKNKVGNDNPDTLTPNDAIVGDPTPLNTTPSTPQVRGFQGRDTGFIDTDGRRIMGFNEFNEPIYG